MQKYKEIIEELGRKIPTYKSAVVSEYNAISKYKRYDDIPSWYLLRLKALCYIYDIKGMEDYTPPPDYKGIPIYYAENYREVAEMLGDDIYSYHYIGNPLAKETGLFEWSIKDYEKMAGDKPGMLVVCAIGLWYIPKNKISLIYEKIQKNHPQNEKIGG